MANFTRVSFANASPRGGGDNRLNSIPAKAKHVNDLITRIEGEHPSTGVMHTGYVDNTTAFIQNDTSNASWVQPGGTVLTDIYLFVALQPTITVNAASNLGYIVGTEDGDGTYVAAQADQLVDAAANTTALKTGAFLHVASRTKLENFDATGPIARLLPVPVTSDATTFAADGNYTATARTIVAGTSASNHAVAAPGTVRWIFQYIQVADSLVY